MEDRERSRKFGHVSKNSGNQMKEEVHGNILCFSAYLGALRIS